MVSEINGLREFRETFSRTIGRVGRPAPNRELDGSGFGRQAATSYRPYGMNVAPNVARRQQRVALRQRWSTA
jgi:hypothetical protein